MEVRDAGLQWLEMLVYGGYKSWVMGFRDAGLWGLEMLGYSG